MHADNLWEENFYLLCALCVLLFPNRIERKGIRKRYAHRELSEMFYPRLSAVDYIP